jgi:hypothetical protein
MTCQHRQVSGEDCQSWFQLRLRLRCRQQQNYNHIFPVRNGYEFTTYGADSAFVSIWRHICVTSHLGNFENVLVWLTEMAVWHIQTGFECVNFKNKCGHTPHSNMCISGRTAEAWKKSNMSSTCQVKKGSDVKDRCYHSGNWYHFRVSDRWYHRCGITVRVAPVSPWYPGDTKFFGFQKLVSPMGLYHNAVSCFLHRT